jgi:cytidylate kinase
MAANTIAIDGPAASGKTTLGKKLAEALGYLFFDTGVMYRAVTWIALQQKLDLNNEQAITQMVERVRVDVRPASQADGRNYDVLVDDHDVTWEIRLPETEANVSLISSYPGVRKALSQQQRRIGKRGKVVMVGRDIGTVVMPEADLKIFLVASVEERARRRYEELIQRGEPAHYQEILEAMRRRDQIDSTRFYAPLKAADDAVLLNSDNLDADEVLNKVLELIKSN